MIAKYLDREPKIDKTCFIAPGAKLVGAVEVAAHSSIWYNVVARGDINEIKIGEYTNIQDGTVIHVADDRGAYIGNNVTVGHNAVIHACDIGDNVLIGMGAVILNGAKIGKGAKIAAGAVICEGLCVPEKTLAMGVPAKITRKLTDQECDKNIYWSKKYAKLSQEFSGRKIL